MEGSVLLTNQTFINFPGLNRTEVPWGGKKNQSTCENDLYFNLILLYLRSLLFYEQIFTWLLFLLMKEI